MRNLNRNDEEADGRAMSITDQESIKTTGPVVGIGSGSASPDPSRGAGEGRTTLPERPPIDRATKMSGLSVEEQLPRRGAGSTAQGALFHQLADAPTVEAMRERLAASLQRSCGATLIAWMEPSDGRIGHHDHYIGLTCPFEGLGGSLRAVFRQLAAEAVEHGVGIWKTRRGQPFVFSAVPLPGLDGQILLVAFEMPGSRLSSGTPTGRAPYPPHVAVDLCVCAVQAWVSAREAKQSLVDAEHIAALAELIQQMHQADHLNEGCRVLSDQLAQHLKADTAAVGICAVNSRECRLAGLAGHSEFNPLSENSRLLEAVFQETISRDEPGEWPPADPTSRYALLAHRQLAKHLQMPRLLTYPVFHQDGRPLSVILVGWKTVVPTSADGATADARVDDTDAAIALLSEAAASGVGDSGREARRFLTAARHSLSASIGLLQRAERHAMSRWLRQRLNKLSGNRRKTLAWIMLAGVLVLCVPVPYRVQCTAELQPVSARFIAAPFEGRLDESYVRPGDLVSEGQLLARMDEREVTLELREVESEIHRTVREKNQASSERRYADAQIAESQVQRLENKADLLRYRLDHLELKSPTAGVVVTGDHHDSIGIPLKQGDSLFEVAPLDQMTLEVLIPEEDFRHVDPGQALSVQLNALPEQALDGELRRIHPRAEVRDGENVFVAEADVVRSSEDFRPGMKGEGRISTSLRPLGWCLLHKPLYHMLGRLGW